MVRFFVCVVLFISTIVGALTLEGISVKAFFAITCLIIVLFVPFFSSLGIWKFNELMMVWKDAFSKEKSDTSATSWKILDYYEKLFYISGILCIVLGSVSILSSLETITKWNIGLAASLIGIIYALIFGIITRILKAKVDK